MSFRDDLAAAHDRIEALEAEVERLTAECAELTRRNDHLEALRRGLPVSEPGFDHERLREQMRREEVEVKAKIQARMASLEDE